MIKKYSNGQRDLFISCDVVTRYYDVIIYKDPTLAYSLSYTEYMLINIALCVSRINDNILGWRYMSETNIRMVANNLKKKGYFPYKKPCKKLWI
jgi:hypothetical protein